MDRLTVSEAAARLGVTPDAVRQRIRRDTIEHEKTEDGRYYVFLTKDDGRRDGVQDALVERLKDENAFLRGELQRKDAIMLSLSEGLKAIAPAQDASPEVPQTPQNGSGDEDGTHVSPEPQKASEGRSWWARLWGI